MKKLKSDEKYGYAVRMKLYHFKYEKMFLKQFEEFQRKLLREFLLFAIHHKATEKHINLVF